MLEPVVALMIAAGPHGPVDSVSQEAPSVVSPTSDVVRDQSAPAPEYTAATQYIPASGFVIDADQLRLYLPYD